MATRSGSRSATDAADRLARRLGARRRARICGGGRARLALAAGLVLDQRSRSPKRKAHLQLRSAAPPLEHGELLAGIRDHGPAHAQPGNGGRNLETTALVLHNHEQLIAI